MWCVRKVLKIPNTRLVRLEVRHARGYDWATWGETVKQVAAVLWLETSTSIETMRWSSSDFVCIPWKLIWSHWTLDWTLSGTKLPTQHIEVKLSAWLCSLEYASEWMNFGLAMFTKAGCLWAGCSFGSQSAVSRHWKNVLILLLICSLI